MDPVISSYLLGLRFGELQQHEKMAVVPIFAPDSPDLDYLPLKTAMERRLLTVTEVSQGGSVPELKVVTTSDVPVLLLDGEELAGAKQNRVLNTTILLKERSETIIPVSCTEQGRWAYRSAEFAESGVVASPRIRTAKVASVTASLADSRRYSSDQSEVWDHISRLTTESEVHSPSSAMRDVFESKSRDLQGYLEAFGIAPKQQGLLVLINGKAIGFDVVSREAAYAALHPKLIKSYALDALVQKEEAAGKPTVDQASHFIEDAVVAEEKKYESVGHGWDYRLQGRELVGSALVYRETVIHTAFFRITESDRAGRMSSSARRSQFRI